MNVELLFCVIAIKRIFEKSVINLIFQKIFIKEEAIVLNFTSNENRKNEKRNEKKIKSS